MGSLTQTVKQSLTNSYTNQERRHPVRALSGFVNAPVAQPVEDDLDVSLLASG